MRIIAKFSIDDRVKYISHLDTMRAIHRGMARANIPIEFSGGFNPHPKIAFAFALPVGTTSTGEYMDIEVKHPMDPSALKERVNSVLPKGIQILAAREIDEALPSLTSMIERAEYRVNIPYLTDDMDDFFQKFLNQKNIIIDKKTKKGIRKMDIREMIFSLEVIKKWESRIEFKTQLMCAGQSNLNPELLVRAMAEFANIDYAQHLPKFHRDEMYIYRNNRWITPLEL